MRSRYLILVAAVVMLAGCGGLAGSDAQSDISIEETTSSDTIDYNSSDYATVSITNDGDSNTSTTVTASFAGDEIHNSTETLRPGSSERVEVVYRSFNLEPGEHDLVFQVGSDSETDKIEVLEPEPAKFEISSIGGTTDLSDGSDAEFDVTVKNTGDLSGSSDVSASFLKEEMNENIQLDAGEQTEIWFNAGEIDTGQGSYSLEVTTSDDSTQRDVEVTHPSYYGSTEISLYVDDSQIDRDVSQIIEESTSYWERNADDHLSFDVEYEIVESRSEADKVLTFEESTTCGAEVSTSYLGCADLVTSDVDRTVKLSVDHRLSDPVLLDTTIHELGHTLGLDHGDEPKGHMSSTYNGFDTQEPVKFYIRSEGGSLPRSTKSEVKKALEFYEDRGDFQYELVDSEEEAHHLITYHHRGTICGFSTGGSCEISGEYKSQIDFRIDQLDSEVVAWHLAIGLAGPAVNELPDEIDPDDDRRDRKRFPQ